MSLGDPPVFFFFPFIVLLILGPKVFVRYIEQIGDLRVTE